MIACCVGHHVICLIPVCLLLLGVEDEASLLVVVVIGEPSTYLLASLAIVWRTGQTDRSTCCVVTRRLFVLGQLVAFGHDALALDWVVSSMFAIVCVARVLSRSHVDNRALLLVVLAILKDGGI